ncbi:unnamed protein product [Lactuca virosa]|uniref:Uncharacterized protein n=1 Tax=Lactuca virosa TaxID=75947 RepID=A0AAU9M6D7_9ASTR|nr:unnamed protein product [Lactuca virosa]
MDQDTRRDSTSIQVTLASSFRADDCLILLLAAEAESGADLHLLPRFTSTENVDEFHRGLLCSSMFAFTVTCGKAANASWNMGEWDQMAEYVSKLDDADETKLRC